MLSSTEKNYMEDNITIVEEFLDNTYTLLYEIDTMPISPEDKEIILSRILDLFTEVLRDQ